MKKRLAMWVALAAMVVLASTATILLNIDEDNQTLPTGTYVVKGVEYLTPISSSTRDYYLQINLGTTFTFTEEAFYADEFYVDATTGEIDLSVSGQIYSEVTYREIQLGNVLDMTNGVSEGIDLSKFAKKKAFRIFSKNIDTGYAFYLLDDEIWISYLNPNSKPQFADYVFSLQIDKLQNRTAAGILNILRAANFPIEEPIVIDDEGNPNGLLGTVNGYISKAEWTDSRGVKSTRSNVSIEVFENPTDCEKRRETLENLYALISSDGYVYFTKGNVLVSVEKGITDRQATLYGEALIAISQGELPSYDGAE